MKSSSLCSTQLLLSVGDRNICTHTHTHTCKDKDKDKIERKAEWRRGEREERFFSNQYDQYFSILHSIRAAQKQFSVSLHSLWNKIFIFFFSLTLTVMLHFHSPTEVTVMKSLLLFKVIVKGLCRGDSETCSICIIFLFLFLFCVRYTF